MHTVSATTDPRCAPMPLRRALLSAVILLLAAMPAAWASEVTIQHTFQANTPALATEVNENLIAFEIAVDDNAVDIGTLESNIFGLQAILSDLQSTVGSQQANIYALQTTVDDQQDIINAQAATIASLQTDLAAVQSNTVLALDGKLGLGTDSKGYPSARFTAVNVQIVNGQGATNTPNGLGNLTIGYNESEPSQTPFCSEGTWDNQADCVGDGQTWAADQRTGSHNLVLGQGNAYSQYGGLVAGAINIISSPYATVTGGRRNIARGEQSSVSGGYLNTASGSSSSISGGFENSADGDYASASGGQENTAKGNFASVSGGVSNYAGGFADSISGGYNNITSGNYASISGGANNSAGGDASSISGGANNTAGGDASSISGGESTTILPASTSSTSANDWAAADLYQDD